jgi:hypothetical protein
MQREKHQDQSDTKDDVIIVGYTQLIGAVLRLTSQDLKFGSKDSIRSARRFVRSPWFSFICEGLCLNPEQVRKLINTTGVKGRKNYE